jgi:hypothetical protein
MRVLLDECISRKLKYALSATWKAMQNSSAPKRSAGVPTNGMSMVTPASRNPDPKCRLINEPCLPKFPKPEAMAGGMRRRAFATGPGYALAL